MRRKKGIALTVNLLILVVMVLVVTFVLFLLYAGIEAESGSASSGFYYKFFDWMLRLIPGSGF